MIKNKAINAVILLLVFISTVSAFAGSLTDEIKWMDNVSGLTYKTGTEHSSSATRMYSVNGDESSIISSIKSGLVKRGWTVDINTIDTAGVKIITLKAAKSAMKLEGTMRSGIAMNSMEVAIRGKASSSSTTVSNTKTSTTVSGKTDTKTTTKTTTTTPVVKTTTATKTTTSSSTKTDVAMDDPNAKQAGAEMTITDNDVKATYKCNNTEFSITGGNNNLILLGTVKSLSINGSDNKITIKGKIGSISAIGSDNTVYWSKKFNPVKPETSSLGSGNVIKSIP